MSFANSVIRCDVIWTKKNSSISDSIKDKNGSFLPLNDLITSYLKSNEWNASRNNTSSFKTLKKFGDLCAHNRRFLAKKNDLDSIQAELRQSVQEIVLTMYK